MILFSIDYLRQPLAGALVRRKFAAEVFNLLGSYTETDLPQAGFGYWLRLLNSGTFSHADTEEVLSYYTPGEPSESAPSRRKATPVFTWKLSSSGLSEREQEIFLAPGETSGACRLIARTGVSQIEIELTKLWAPLSASLHKLVKSSSAYLLSYAGAHGNHSILVYPSVADLYFLRRARDCSFPLIPQTSKRNILVFFPEEEQLSPGSYETIARAFSDCLLAPLCFTESQVSAAQTLAASGAACHLADLRKSGDIFISLMHTLSGCDAAFCAHTRPLNLADIIDIRLQAILAAYAGLPLLIFSHDEEPRTSGQEPRTSTKSTSCPIWLDAPNLAVVGLSEAAEKGRRILAQASQGIDVQAADEWLRGTTHAALSERVNRLVVSILGCYNPVNSMI